MKAMSDHRGTHATLRSEMSLEKFFKNPVGYLVLAIIALVVIAANFGTLVKLAALIFFVAVAWHGAKLLLKKGKGNNGGAYCPNCGHGAHGNGLCMRSQCRCTGS